jgi:hypothetical protein
MGVQSVTRSYEYNALCDVCKFKYKASQLRLRWDGLQVCKWDWEQRHPADFYRGRNDAHKLPWTRSDDGADPALHFNPTVSGMSTAAASTETASFPSADYYLDTLQGLTNGKGFLVQWLDSTGFLPVLFPISKSTTAGGSFTLPTTPTTGGQVLFRSTYKLIGTVPVVAGVNSVVAPIWTSLAGNILVSFSYGT